MKSQSAPRQQWRNALRRRGAAFVGVGVGLLLSSVACGSNVDTPAVASVGGGATAARPGATTNAIAHYVDAQRKWVKCMRGQGYNLPDPDPKGFVDLGAFLASAKLAKTDPGLLAAQQKCMSVQEPAPNLQVPQLTQEQIENRREYAKCMRVNGAPDWPDPAPNGDWPNVGSLAEGLQNQAEQDARGQALQICDPVLDGKPPASPDPNKIPQG